MNKQVTIKDVASIAEVSPKTVSNYLNGTAKVNPTTGERIAKAIESLNYSPNIIAQRFRTGKSFIIGFVVDISFLDNPVTHHLEYEFQRRLKESRYSLEVIVVDDRDKTLPFDARVLDGIIVSSASSQKILKQLSMLEIPVVSLRRFQSRQLCIVVDDYLGGMLAAKHLIQNNHTQIGILTNKSELVGDDFQLRRKGFIDTLHKAGLEPVIELESPLKTQLMMDWFESLGSLLWENDITAYFSTTDMTALGLINYLFKNQIRVPDDISVIGFDNIAYTALCIPPLTTISGQFDKLARLAVRHLIDEIESNEADHLLLTIEPQLIERSSVKVL